MSCNWPNVALGKYCSKIGSGATPKGGNSVYLDSGEITLIRSQNIYNEGFKSDGLVYITPEAAQKLKNVIIEPNDVLINITGDSVARVCLAPKEHFPARVNQHVAIIRVDPKEFDHRYLRYYLTSLKMQSYLLTIASSGATRNALTKSMLESLEVSKPPLDIQKKIGDVLEQFENKIQLNTQTNQTLEEMAQAIFKSWFVDFDPVKAKMNGEQPEGMDDATASLFPEKLVESELGLIPEGWDILPLSSYINIKHGFAFKGEYFSDQETGDICVTPGNFHIGGGIKLDKFKYYDGPISEDYIFSKGDLMVTMTDLSKQADTLGYPAFVPESEGKTYLHNQRIGKVELKFEQDIKNYLYSFFCSSGYRNEVLSGVTGSTVKHTAPKKIMAIEVALDLRVAYKFSQLVAPLFEKKAQNLAENSYLEKLRDTLLPKLLSGEIELGSVATE
jgi:type I restriction enzyme, S subunit